MGEDTIADVSTPRPCVERLRTGTRLICWASFLSALFGQGYAFLLPFLGGSMSDLHWTLLIYAVGAIPLCIGVWLLSSFDSDTNRIYVTGLPFLALIYVGCLWLRYLRVFDENSERVVFVGESSAEIFGTLLVFIYIRRIAMRFEKMRFGTIALITGVLYATVIFLGVYGGILAQRLPSLQAAMGSMVDVMPLLLQLGVGMIAFPVVWRFGSEIEKMVRGRCLRCGYDLAFGKTGRCPECGSATLST